MLEWMSSLSLPHANVMCSMHCKYFDYQDTSLVLEEMNESIWQNRRRRYKQINCNYLIFYLPSINMEGGNILMEYILSVTLTTYSENSFVRRLAEGEQSGAEAVKCFLNS